MDRRHMARQLIKGSTSDNPVDILLLRSNVTPEDLTDPGDDRFKSPLLRVTLGTGGGVVHSELKERLYGSTPPSPEKGGETMADPVEKGKPIPGLYADKLPLIRQCYDQVRQGLKKRNLSDLARELEVSRSAIQYYFDKWDKQAQDIAEAAGTNVVMERCETKPLPTDSFRTITPVPSLPSLQAQRNAWIGNHAQDQEAAAFSARVIQLLDAVEEKFGNGPLADQAAYNLIVVLVAEYRKLKEVAS